VLSRYADAIMIRTDHHHKAEELAEFATVPVINGLTDLSHPCQILADMQTVLERKSKLAGSRWTWVGDGNNVCNSLIEAASLLHFELAVACPNGFEPDPTICSAAAARGGRIHFTENPREAVAGAEVVVTDTWVSMGQDGEEYRREAFAPFQVDEELMALAAPDATFLHCLPAHRGEEVVDSVIDGPRSAVWDEAENRLHAQKALLLWALGKIG
jgi:ornithine carbamoyltransferase